MIRRAKLSFLPVALVAAGVMALVFSGCEKAEKAGAEPVAAQATNKPAAFMQDPVFRALVAEKRQALQRVINERKPLVDRMQALVKRHGEDRAALEKVPEWNYLYKKVEALNAKFERIRKEQLSAVKKAISK